MKYPLYVGIIHVEDYEAMLFMKTYLYRLNHSSFVALYTKSVLSVTFIHTHTTQLKKDINLFTKYIKGYSVES